MESSFNFFYFLLKFELHCERFWQLYPDFRISDQLLEALLNKYER